MRVAAAGTRAPSCGPPVALAVLSTVALAVLSTAALSVLPPALSLLATGPAA